MTADQQMTLPEPPYPPEILARGWSFSVDTEKLEGSDTWALAGSELRPWLLMVWLTSWKSQPVGTMPTDQRLFAARIGMPQSMFKDAAEVLMRGWVKHSDGLMYHREITSLVMEMVAKRTKDAARVAAWRAAKKEVEKPELRVTDPDVTRDKDVTDPLVTRESQACTTPIPIPIPKGGDIGPQPSAAAPVPARQRPSIPECPHEEIIALWAEQLPSAIQPRAWSGKRAEALRARWREDKDRQGLKWWEDFFAYVAKSDFLMGRTGGTRAPFQLSLDWLCKADNFLKVIEGRYENRGDEVSGLLAGGI